MGIPLQALAQTALIKQQLALLSTINQDNFNSRKRSPAWHPTAAASEDGHSFWRSIASFGI